MTNNRKDRKREYVSSNTRGNGHRVRFERDVIHHAGGR